MRILAIGCHPDDLEINCFGTLAKYIKLGHEVTVCPVADGCCGHETIPPAELVALRRAEAEAAARVIGANFMAVGVPDMHIDAQDHAQIAPLAAIVRRVRPDVVITHTEEDYMDDHIQTSRLALSATFAASLPNYDVGTNDPATPVCPLFYMEPAGGLGFIPMEYVDISQQIELKTAAMRCHKTQLEWLSGQNEQDAMESVTLRSAARGRECGVMYAEGFRPCAKHMRMSAKRLLP